MLTGARVVQRAGACAGWHRPPFRRLEEGISLAGKDDDDLTRELFGDVIYSYTDSQAIEDGVLIPFTAGGKDTRHRITSNAYHKLTSHYDAKGYEYDDARYLRFFLHELLPLAPEAYRRWENSSILKTNYDFEVCSREDGEILWYVPNELNGITVMKPEDY